MPGCNLVYQGTRFENDCKGILTKCLIDKGKP